MPAHNPEEPAVRPPALTPWSLPLLLGRIAREWESRGTIFDLPPGRFFKSPDDCDLSLRVAGRCVATPAGPAAGPHTQLAQNLVLGWLAGARSFELKTVQILDQLEIERPCIDMATVGYNVEWSQELTLDESLREYAKAWLMLAILRAWPPLREVLGDPGDHVFELSVGYDLAGIQSPRMRRFIDGMLDAGDLLEELAVQVPPPFVDVLAGLDTPPPTRIVDSATVSTFHGCPPDEIEAIGRHLMDSHGLDVTIKLNPTLLGIERVTEILHRQLGYDELRLMPEAFAQDLAFDRALTLIRDLAAHGRRRGRTCGIKLTNTLVVANHKALLPGEQMYLSGAPLHALAIQLLAELDRNLPGLLQLGSRQEGLPVAFSAGIDRENFATAVGLGLAPVTICSDLLKPGGYGRLTPLLRRLVRNMQAAGCGDLAAWRAILHEQAITAGYPGAVAAYAATLTGADGRRRYSHAATAKPPRSVPDRLQIWDCCCCNLCVTVCPNDAMLRLTVAANQAGRLKKEWQYVCLAELCNACGNCTTFCPEQGEPFRDKPRLYFYPERFTELEPLAFLVKAADPAAASPFTVAAAPAAADTATVPAAADDAAILADLCNAVGGLPLRGGDLPTAT